MGRYPHSIDQRFSRIENRIDKLYQSQYTIAKNRKRVMKQFARLNILIKRMEKWEKVLSHTKANHMLSRLLSELVPEKRSGRKFIRLDNKQSTKFFTWLKNDFRTSGEGIGLKKLNDLIQRVKSLENNEYISIK